ncbi:MAG: carboxypeptidase regulatory-like domain-containing protein, partial [Sphingobacteriia bacterium]
MRIFLLCWFLMGLGLNGIIAQPLFGHVQGRVTQSGKTLLGAAVILQETETNTTKKVFTDASGQYAFGFLKPQHLYVVHFHFPGQDSLVMGPFSVAAGETVFVDGTWPKQNQPLPDLVLKPSAGQKGQESMGRLVLTARSLAHLPLMSDPWRALGQILPTALPRDRLTGLVFLGQHPRFNAVYVDGVLVNDFTGLSPTGTYGGMVGSLPFAPGQAEKIEWQLSPFDPAYAGFSGAAIHFFGPTPTGKPFLRARIEQRIGQESQYQWGVQGRSAWRPRWFASWQMNMGRSQWQATPNWNFYQGQLNLPYQADMVLAATRERLGWEPGRLLYYQFKQSFSVQLSLQYQSSPNSYWIFRVQHHQAWRQLSGSFLPQHLVAEKHGLHQKNQGWRWQTEWHQARKKYKTQWAQLTLQKEMQNQDPLGPAQPLVRIWDSTHWWIMGTPENAIDNRSQTHQIGFRYMETKAQKTALHSWGMEAKMMMWENHFLPQLQGSYTYFSVLDFLRNRRPGAYSLRFTKGFKLAAPRMALHAPQLALHYQWQKKWTPQSSFLLGIRAEWHYLGPGPSIDSLFLVHWPQIAAAYPETQAPVNRFRWSQLGLSPRVQYNGQSANGRYRWGAGWGRFQGQMPMVWRAGAWAHNGQQAWLWEAKPPSLSLLNLPNGSGDPRPLTPPAAQSLSMVQWQDPRLQLPLQWRNSLYFSYQRGSFRWQIEANYYWHQNEWRTRNLILQPPTQRVSGLDNRPLYGPEDSLHLYSQQGQVLPYEALLYLDNRPGKGGWGWQVHSSLQWKSKNLEGQVHVLRGESYSYHDGQGSFLLNTWRFQPSAQDRNHLALARSDYSPGYQYQIAIQGRSKWRPKQAALEWQMQWQVAAGAPYSFVYGKQSLARDLPQWGGYDLLYVPLQDEVAQMLFVPLVQTNVYYSPQWQAEALEKTIQAHPYL